MTFGNSLILARRWSDRDEPDFVQETFVNNDTSHSYIDCSLLATKTNSTRELPTECLKYKDVIRRVTQNMKTDHNIAFNGMGKAAVAAAKARGLGQENYAQVQRRFTNNERRFTKNRSNK